MDIFEKITPSNIDAERAVLGSMLLDKEAVSKVLEVLSAESFYVPSHQVLFDTIKEIFFRNSPVDIVTVTDALQNKAILDEIGGYTYLIDLAESVPTTANVEQYAKIVEEKHIRRELIKSSNEIIKKAYESSGDISEVLDDAEKSIFAISQKRSTKDLIHIKDTLVTNFNNINENYHHEGGKVDVLKSGVSTGISSLDEMISGLNPPDLLIIAARPAMGKTAFVLNLATNVALKERAPVAIFSLEMSRDQIAQRILSAEAGISSYHMKAGNISQETWTSIADTVGKLYNIPIYIDDSGSLSPMEMRAKVRRLKSQHKKLGVVIVDYLQLMEGSGSEANRVQEISKVTRALKRLAMEMQVPVIALSQLSRSVESRQNKRPQLSDLRESGCVTGDTLVIDSETGHRIPIKQLLNKNFQTIALSDNLKLDKHNVSNVFYSGKKMVYELKTRTGKSIKASANHPFMKISGWTRLDNLKIGDKIAVAKNISKCNSNNSIKDNEIILLAHLIDNDCITSKRSFSYKSINKDNIDIVNKISFELFGINSKIVQQKKQFHIDLKSPYRLSKNNPHPITKWYKSLGLDLEKSYNKSLPQKIFELSYSKICLFLKHLWSDNGSISADFEKNNISINYSSNSKLLSEQVHHLLLRIGIISTIKKISSNDKDIYNLYIIGNDNQLKFLKEVSCYEDKDLISKKIVNHIEKIISNTNYDVLPKDSWKYFIEPLKVQNNISLEFSSKLEMPYCRTALYKNDISQNIVPRINNIIPNNKIKDLYESDILWDEIISIDEIGIDDVYDATVDGVHNFLANDFIVHNSIEQDADIVMFIYRDEYYNPDSAKTKIAEIIIAKHRNGPTGTVELYFDADLTKFSGLERNS
jgi:replicative DNA helicase